MLHCKRRALLFCRQLTLDILDQSKKEISNFIIIFDARLIFTYVVVKVAMLCQLVKYVVGMIMSRQKASCPGDVRREV